MKKTTIIAIILGVLVFISIVQAVQLGSLKTKVAEGQLSVGSSSKTSSPQQSSIKKTAPLPKSVQNLPQMVGGC